MEERRVLVSSSVQVSRSLTATSGVKLLVLSRSNGLVAVAEFVMDEGLDRTREVDGTGVDGGELGVPTDLMRRLGGVGASLAEWGLSM